ncbi:tandem-95 repeat protein, partial [bacterium]|nr:tandem-95 repeat protein [bacterium]
MKRSNIFLLMVSILVLPVSDLFAQHFETAVDHGSNHSLAILEATINAENLSDEDEIGVFTPSGVCAGAEIIAGDGPYGFPVWGDDPATQELDGFLTDQPFSFRIWDASENTEYEAHARFMEGPRVWSLNDMTRIERLFWFSDQVPVIQPATYSCDFGLVGVDRHFDLQLNIENIGFGTLTISDITTNDGAFATEFENEIGIDPGESYDLTVIFTPDAEGEFDGILSIESDDPENDVLEIDLSGTGTNEIAPEISLSEEEHDFGEWAIGLCNSWTLRITNTGTDTLTIENIEIEDGVFSTDWEDEVKLGPQRTYRLEVYYEPTDEENYASDLIITSDDPNNGEVSIPISGLGVEWEYHFFHIGRGGSCHTILAMETLLNNEYLEIGDEIGLFTPGGDCGGMRVIDERADPDGMIGLAAWNDEINTGFVEGFREGEELNYRIWDVSAGVEVIAVAEYTEGSDEWDGNGWSVVNLSAEYDPVPAISVSPLVIDFGEIYANQTDVVGINIVNNGQGDLNITNMALTDDEFFTVDFQVGFMLRSEHSRVIEVSFSPLDVADYQSSLIITTNSPGKEEITIPLTGVGLEPPQTIEVEEREHDFGIIEIDNQANWTLVMMNTGWTDLRIDRIEIDNGAYSHNFENAVTLGREETYEVEVTFTPDQEGNYDTELTIFSNDPNNGEFPVTLLGEGGVVPVIVVDPEDIDFGTIIVNDVLARRFTISNAGSGDLNVTDISVMGQGFSVNFADDFVLAPDESQLVPVYFNPPDDRDYNAQVTIMSDDPNNGEVHVNVIGTGEMRVQDIALRYVVDEDYDLTFETQDVDNNVDGDTRGVRAVDLDSDGDMDVIGAHGTAVSWWENDGNQDFTRHLINDDVHRAYWVEAADVDLDGDIDILSAADAREDDGITWWENDGDQNFTEHSIEGGFDSNSIYAIDIDGDLDIDVAATDYHGNNVSWWENDGLGEFTKHSIIEDWERPSMVYPIDFDEDGDVDIVANADGEFSVAWFRNDGDQNFTYVEIGQADHGFCVSDIDSDGDLDVVSNFRLSDRLIWFENDGDENFSEHVILKDYELPGPVWVDDFDYDGDMDIVAGHQRSPYIAYLENDGEENFNLTDISQGLSVNPVSLYSFDIDGDGDVDILCSDGTDRIVWWNSQFEVTHDFGRVLIEEGIGIWSFVIANTGDQVLRITDIAPNPDNGIYTTNFEAQINLDPGETTEIEVTFDPADEANYNCTLNIESDDPDDGTVNVTLTGIGSHGNRAPEIANPIDNLQLDEDFDRFTVANLNFVFSDPDGDPMSFEVFTDNENFTAELLQDTLLRFDSADDWFGDVVVTIVADDEVARDDDNQSIRQLRFTAHRKDVNNDQMMLNDGQNGFHLDHGRRDDATEDEVDITVNPVNDPPVWTDIPEDDIAVDEGAVVEFTVTGEDIDNAPDELGISYTIPEGAEFTDHGDGTGSFSWQTSYDSEGNHTVRLILSDGELTDTAWVNISVGNINHRPVLAAIGDKTVDENDELTFTLEATDSDNDDLTFFGEGLPEGAELNGANFRWTPTYDQSGDYDVTFIVRDDGEGELTDQETITITVTNVNRPPVLTAIGNQNVQEEEELTLTLTANDPDGDGYEFSAEDLPEGAELNGADFSWTPTNDQEGNYQVTFIVTDDGNPQLTDEETITISVGNVNLAPEFEEIGDREVNENTVLTFMVTATDPDGDNVTIDATSEDLPEGWGYTDNGNGTCDFNWTPDFDQSGTYHLTFVATDDGEGNLTDEETITITVHNVNRPPVLTGIGNKAAYTGSELAFTLEADDPDGDNLIFSSDDLPEGAEINGDEFTWTPSVAQVGDHSITFIVTDDGVGHLTDDETITITVHETNVAPVWEDAPETIDVEEGDLVEFSFTGSDPNEDDFNVSFDPDGLPEGYDYSYDGAGTVSFSWQTGFDDGGVYRPIFTIYDAEFATDAEVVIRVGEVNRPPEWVDYPQEDVAGGENEEITFRVSGSDLDGDDLTITYSSDNIPDEEVTFTDYGNGTADFSWTPSYEAAGEYEARFDITDEIEYEFITVTIIVNDVNRPPQWIDYPQQTVQADEGDQVIFTVEGEDLDGDNITIDFSSDDLPDELFSDLGNGFGRFTWQTDNEDAGDYSVTFTLSDGELDESIDVQISIGDVNRAPVWVDFPDSPFTVNESEPIQFLVVADDPDGDALTVEAVSDDLPEGWSFNDNDDGTGTFSWQTDFGDNGEYTLTITASDGMIPIERTLDITVNVLNRAPYWTNIPDDEHVDLGDEMQFSVEGIDPDNDDLTIYYTSDDIPDNARFDDHGDGRGTFTWHTSDNDEGSYTATFTLSDGEFGDDHDVIITVGDVNRPPRWVDVPGDITVDEEAFIEFRLTASDPNDDLPIFSHSNVGWPNNAELVDREDGTADFTWQTTFDDDGEYTLRFIVSDGEFNVPTTVIITVNDVNQAPEWTMAPGNVYVEEGELIQFQVRGVDPNGDIITMTYESDDLPEDADFNILGNGVGLFRWQTELNDEGEYSALFSMSDGELTSDTLISITVTPGNRPPELDEIGDKQIAEGSELIINLSADDPNGDNVFFSVEDFPNGSELVGNRFRWTPNYDQAGEYDVTFRVTDDGEPQLSDRETITITVTNTNRTPLWVNPIASDEENETGTLTFTLAASDADGDNVTLRMESDELPEEAQFTDNHDGTGDFYWETTYEDAGTYHATFIVSDDDLESETEIELIVNNVNREPVWEEFPGDQDIDENRLLVLDLVGSDPDGDEVAINIDRGNLPDGFTFDYEGNGVAEFRWRPSYNDSGVYRFGFILSDEFEDVKRNIEITVNHVNRRPIWTSVPQPFVVYENEFINFVVRGNDPDGDELTIDYSSEDIPDDGHFSDAGGGVGIFSWQTTYEDEGSYTATFTLSDEEFNVTADVSIEVVNVNIEPYWLYVPGNVVGYENSEVEFTLQASDPEGDDLTITYESDDLPDEVDFTDNHNGSADFYWITDYVDAGEYTATFRVSDGDLSITTDVPITINDVNRPPVWTEVPVRVDGYESEEISFNIASEDHDGDDLTLSLDMQDLPEGIEFTDHHDGRGSVSWYPTFDDGGQYIFVFTASDGVYNVDTRVLVDVAEVNREPVWTDIPRQVQWSEGEMLEFDLIGEDEDGDNLTITMESDDLPNEATLIVMDNGYSVFSWDVGYDAAGDYDATFTISDDEADVEEVVSFTIRNVNQSPVWVVAPANVQVDEGRILSLTLVAVDYDDDEISIAYSSNDLPEAAQFTDYGDGTCTLSWQTTFADSGRYNADFTASDGDIDNQTTVVIHVGNVNGTPVWDEIPESVEVDEGEPIRFTVRGHDPEDVDLEIQYNSFDLPEAVSFEDRHDGSGLFTWQTTYEDAGDYQAVFTLFDDLYDVPAIVSIRVNDVNRAPYWDDEVPAIVRADEGELIEFDISGVDPDGDELSLAYQMHYLPDEAEFITEGGNGSFSWQTSFEDAGDNYILFLRLSDGDHNVDRQIQIVVGGENRAPVLDEIGDQNIDEGEELRIRISASDPDDDNLFYSAEDLPNGADLDGADFSWTPGYNDEGEHEVTFIVTDDGNPPQSAEETITIVVNNVNQPPVWMERPDDLTIYGFVDQDITVSLWASDPDGEDMLEIDWEWVGQQPADPDVIYEQNDVYTIFGISPDRFEAGEYHARVFASDGEFEISLELTFDVSINHFVWERTNRRHDIRVNYLNHFGDEYRRDEPNDYDEIGVLTPDGVVAGSHIFVNAVAMPIGIEVWGDNPNTQEIEGFRTGEAFTFLYWDYNAGEEYDMGVRITAGNEEWQNNGFSVVELFIGYAVITDPVSYNFGYVPTEIEDPGDSAFVQITITNIGTVPLEGLIPSVIGEGFLVVDQPIDIDVDEEAFIDVFFAPQRHGAHEGRFVVMLDDNELASTELTGFGIEMGHFQYTITQTIHRIDVLETRVFDLQNMFGRQLEPGEEIGVFTIRDTLCAGAVILTENRPYTILAFGDDPETQEIDGFSEDEGFVFMFYLSPDDLPMEAIAYADYREGPSTWQENGYSVVTLNESNTHHFNPIITDRYHALKVESVDFFGEDITELDDIAAVTSQGLVAGSKLLDHAGDDTTAFFAYGDDPETEDIIEGFRDGENIYFRIWDESAGQEYHARAEWTAGPEQWENNAYSRVRLTVVNDEDNNAPTFRIVDDVVVDEGDPIEDLVIRATDADGDPISLSLIGVNLPQQAGFEVLGNGVGVFTWQTQANQAGRYTAMFRAYDGFTETRYSVPILIRHVNSPPVLAEIGNREINEGEPLVIILEADDPNGDEMIFTADNMPFGASIVSGIFRWTPNFQQSDEYMITFRVTDFGQPAMSDEEEVTITVWDRNQPPVWRDVDPIRVYEGAIIGLFIIADDPDGEENLHFDSFDLPEGSWVEQDDEPGVLWFAWDTDFESAGYYSPSFVVIDEFDAADTLTLDITVLNTNRMPTLDHIDNQQVIVGNSVEFEVSAHDADSEDDSRLELIVVNSPPGISVEDIDGDNWLVTWAPMQHGVFSTTRFRVVDTYGGWDDQSVIFTALASDETPPVITNMQPRNEEVIQFSRPAIRATISDEESGIDYIEMTFDDEAVESFTYNTRTGAFIWVPGDDLEDGDHTYTISVVDMANNRTTVNIVFIVNTNPGDIQVDNDIIYTAYDQINLTGTSVPFREMEIWNGDELVGEVDSDYRGRFTFVDVSLVEELNTFTIREHRGLLHPVEIRVYLDIQEPNINLTYPGQFLSDSTPRIRADISDDGVGLDDENGIFLSIDGNEVAEFGFNGGVLTYNVQNALEEGIHVVSILAVDLLGNTLEDAVDFEFMVDSRPPMVDHPFFRAPTDTIYNQQPELNIAINDPSPSSGVAGYDIVFSVDDEELDYDYYDVENALYYNFEWDDPLETGLHRISVDVYDRAQNRIRSTGSFYIGDANDVTGPEFTNMLPPDGVVAGLSGGEDGPLQVRFDADTVAFVVNDRDAGVNWNTLLMWVITLNDYNNDNDNDTTEFTLDDFDVNQATGMVKAPMILPDPDREQSPGEMGPDLGEGVIQIDVFSEDDEGNEGEDSWQFFLDATEPEAPYLDDIADYYVNNTQISVSGTTGSDEPEYEDGYENIPAVRIYRNDDLVAEVWTEYESDFTVDNVLLVEGLNILKATVVDAGGNESEFSESDTLFLDLTEPEISRFTTPRGPYISDVTPGFYAVVRDEGSGIDVDAIEFRIDNSATAFEYDDQVGAFSATAENDLAEGSHTAELQVTDMAGNQSMQSYDFSIILPPVEPPEFTLTPYTSNNRALLRGMRDLGEEVVVFLNNRAVGLAEEDDDFFDFNHFIFDYSAGQLPDTSWIKLIAVSSDSVESDTTEAQMLLIDADPPVFGYNDPANAIIVDVWDLDTVAVLVSDDAAGLDADNFTMSIRGNPFQFRTTETDSGYWIIADVGAVEFANNEAVRVIATAQDMSYSPNTGQFSWEFVTRVGASPIVFMPDTSFNEDEQFAVNLYQFISDEDNSRDELDLTAELIQNIEHVEFALENDGVMRIVPEHDWFGALRIVITVEDPDQQTGIDTVLVNVLPVNDAPVFAAIPDTTGYERRWFELLVTATDVDPGDNLTFFDNTDLFDIRPSGLIFFQPTRAMVGLYEIELFVQDEAGARDETTFILEIEAVNHAIERLADIADVEIEEDDDAVIVADLDDIFSDPDDDQLAYSIDISPGNAGLLIEIEAVSNIISLQPEQDYFGEAFVTITADDRHGSMEDVDFTVIVNPINDEPDQIRQLALDFALTEDYGRYIIADLDTVFVDPDGDELWFWCVPEGDDHLGLDINENNVFSLTPDKDWFGTERFSLHIGDEGLPIGGPVRDLRSRGFNRHEVVSNASFDTFQKNASMSFSSLSPGRDDEIQRDFYVEITPVNDYPVINNPIEDQQFEEDSGPWDVVNLYDVFEEVDGENMTFDIFASEPLIGSESDGILQLLAPENFYGNQIEIVVIAEDEIHQPTQDTFYVDILSINDPPSVIGAIGDRVFDEDTGPWFIADLDDVFEDVDGDQLSYD